MIRDAKERDIPYIIDLIEHFYDEAPYDAPVVNREKAAYVLLHLIPTIGQKTFLKVIDAGPVLAGVLYAERVPDLWSDATLASEGLMYVRPEWRKTLSAGRLLVSFARWSQEIPSVVRVEASSGINDEHAAAVFDKLGWSRRGVLHGMEAY